MGYVMRVRAAETRRSRGWLGQMPGPKPSKGGRGSGFPSNPSFGPALPTSSTVASGARRGVGCARESASGVGAELGEAGRNVSGNGVPWTLASASRSVSGTSLTR
jgi:hypothetical protein